MRKIIIIVVVFLLGVLSTLAFKSITQVEVLNTLDDKASTCIHDMLDKNSCYELAIQEVNDEIQAQANK